MGFSRGNLWAHISNGPDATGYNYTADSWGFHTNQWDYCNQSLAVGNTVDHFGWVGESASYDSYGLCSYGSANNAYYGTSASDALKTDWGSIPGVVSSCGSGWRAITRDELVYLFDTRSTGGSVAGTSNARYTQATIRTDISGVNGVILFPDGVTFSAGEFSTVGILNSESEFTTKCTAAQWAALEAKGCVFLTTAGARNSGITNNNANVSGYYWTGSPLEARGAHSLGFFSGRLNPDNDWVEDDRRRGFAVRLVKNF